MPPRRRARALPLLCALAVLSLAAGAIVPAAGVSTADDSSLDDTLTTETLETTTETSLTEATDTTDSTLNDSTDTFESTTDSTLNESTETLENTIETTENTTDSTLNDSTETLENTTDATDSTLNESADTLESTTETTENTTDSTLNDSTETLESTTETLENTTDSTLNDSTETLENTSDSVAGIETDTTSWEGVVASGSGESSLVGSYDESGGAGTATTTGLLVTAPTTVVSRSDGPRSGTTGSRKSWWRVPGGDPSPLQMAGGASAGVALAAGVAVAVRRVGVAGPVAPSLLSHLLDLLEWLRLRAHYVGGVAGYSRYDDSDPLEHETRAALYDHIADAPGDYLSDIAREAGVPLSTARYHLSVLEAEGVVDVEKRRGRRCYFPVSADAASLAESVPTDGAVAVLEAVRRHEPASGSDIARALDRDPSTVSHHLDALEEAGLVDREREGRAIQNRLSDLARDALEDEREADPPPTADAA